MERKCKYSWSRSMVGSEGEGLLSRNGVIDLRATIANISY